MFFWLRTTWSMKKIHVTVGYLLFFLEIILVGWCCGNHQEAPWLGNSRVTAGISGMTLSPGDLSLIFLKARIAPSCMDSCPQLVLPEKHNFSLKGCCPKLTFTKGGQGRGRVANCKAQTQKICLSQGDVFLCWNGSEAKCKTISLIVMKTRPRTS